MNASPLPSIEEGQKLLSSLCAGAHTPQHAASSSRTRGLLHTTHNHAQMSRFHNHANTTRFQDLGNGQGYLLGEPFLDLKSAREHFSQTGEFGETEDSTVGDVADVHLLMY